MANEIIKNMTNLADSGQDTFVANWKEMAKITLHEMGVSNTFLTSSNAEYILAKVVTDLIEDGDLSATTKAIIATLRVNHPHTEDVPPNEPTEQAEGLTESEPADQPQETQTEPTTGPTAEPSEEQTEEEGAANV